MNENAGQADMNADTSESAPAGQVSEPEEELRLSELLILASLWMLFGFMLWFYLSAFHGAPARMLSGTILAEILGDHFSRIVPQPDQNFLFQVETTIRLLTSLGQCRLQIGMAG